MNTPTTRSGEKPTNQTSFSSLVVPVLPASGLPTSFWILAAAAAFPLVMLVDGVAVTILDAVDQARRDLLAAIVKHRISADHAQERGLASAERERQIGRQI